RAIRPSIRGSDPKTQKASPSLPTSHNLLLNGSLLQRQLHRAFEMSQQEPDVFERCTGLLRLMDGIVTERLSHPGIDKQGLRLRRSLSKTQHRLPLPTADELGK